MVVYMTEHELCRRRSSRWRHLVAELLHSSSAQVCGCDFNTENQPLRQHHQD